MKKGQLEIFGIAILFVFFIIGLLVFVKLSSNRQSAVAEDFYLKQLPTKVLQTMTDVTTDCKNQKVSTLLIDIGTFAQNDTNPVCSDLHSPNQISCDGISERSYDALFANDGVVVEILKNSLENSSIDYELSITRQDGCMIYNRTFNSQYSLTTDGCKGAKKIFSDTFPLMSRTGRVDMTLRVC